jgi:hypothetical protein
MALPQRNVVVGVFENPQQAQQAVVELRRIGFRDDQLESSTHEESVRSDLVANAAGGTGTAQSTVVGALIERGIPEEEARWYEGEIQTGQVLVTVQSAERYNEAFAVLHRFGAYDAASGRPPTAVDTSASPSREVRTGLCVPVKEPVGGEKS